MKPRFGRIEEVNKELWLLLSLFGICLLLNLVVDGQRMVLSFYTLPTLGLGLPLRTPPRDADGVRQRAARVPDDVVQPGPPGGHGRDGRRRQASGSTSSSGAACSSSPATRWARSTSTARARSASCARPITAC